jgi:dihydroorotase
MQNSVLIRNGRLLDPDTGTDAVMDLWIEGGVVTKRTTPEETASCVIPDETQIIDASGCYVCPGLIDLHVHLRDPGFTQKETIETGSKAMAKGGFTGVCCMPNTNPVTDCPEVVRYIYDEAERVSPIHIYPVGAVTKGQAGEELAEIEAMADMGVLAISEDGKSVMNAALYAEGMKLAAKRKMVVMAHCEDRNLVRGGCINAGAKAEELGVKGITNAVEDVIVARDILLAKETGARLHLCHCSTEDSVKLIAAAKAEGLPVTGEVCPHHFAMTDEEIVAGDSNFKMNPPLRSRRDVDALIEGLKCGTMDCISTDHAPHTAEEKAKPIDKAPFGIVGSETAVALTITHLVRPGHLTPLQMVEKMSYNPARVLGIDRGSLAVGKAADVVIIDPEAEYVIDPETFLSKGKNTPFGGKRVYGRVRYTLVDGRVVYTY